MFGLEIFTAAKIACAKSSQARLIAALGSLIANSSSISHARTTLALAETLGVAVPVTFKVPSALLVLTAASAYLMSSRTLSIASEIADWVFSRA